METLLNNKRILAIGDVPGEFDGLKNEIVSAAPHCRIDVAASVENAHELMASFSYDLMLFNIRGEKGHTLLASATRYERPFPVVALDSALLSTELRQKLERSRVKTHVLDKEHPVPFLENVLSSDYVPFIRRVMNRVGRSIRGTETRSRA
jgi:hypothetical protein